MKATFNAIAKQLATVFADKAESAQYYSDNAQYIGMCGWCGNMSPVSRPAYFETFGQDGDPIHCTGWQFVGYNLAAVLIVLLSIKY